MGYFRGFFTGSVVRFPGNFQEIRACKILKIKNKMFFPVLDNL
jgi:hypothetical protein